MIDPRGMSIDSALRHLKRQLRDAGWWNDVIRTTAYTKPSAARRLKSRRARRRKEG